MLENEPANNAEKPKQNNIDDSEISKLRGVVLSWIEKAKNMNPTIDDLKKKKKQKKEKKEEVEIKNPIAKVEAIHSPKIKNFTPAPAVQKKSAVSASDKTQIPVKLELDPISKKLRTSKPTKKSKNKIQDTQRPIFGGKDKPMLKRIPPKKTTAGFGKIIKKIIYVILILIIIGLIILGVSVYAFKAKNSTVMAITKVIPLPVAVVNLKLISYYSWRTQVNTLENFYQKQKESNPAILPPSQKETEQHILERTIDNVILKQEAKKYNLEVSQKNTNTYIETLITEIGSQAAFESQIKDLYSWSIEEFTKEIVNPLILKSQLSSAIIFDDRINEKARLTAQQALNEVKEAQLSFEALAQKYSEDITAVQGGDLGYFSRGQLETSFEEAAFALKPGEVSELVQTQYGYHIIKVEETLLNEDDEVIQIRAKHILIRGKDLDTYLSEIKKDATIWRLISI